METAREKYYMMNTMLCLLKTLEGKRTTVEMRDEREVTGKIVKVDGHMNISMRRVKWKSLTSEKCFDEFFVSGKMIRYVHIPDEIDMKTAMNEYLSASCPNKAAQRIQQEIKDHAWRKMQKKHRNAQKTFEKEKK